MIKVPVQVPNMISPKSIFSNLKSASEFFYLSQYELLDHDYMNNDSFSKSLKRIKYRTEGYLSGEMKIPTQLDPLIEKTFSPSIQEARQECFETIVHPMIKMKKSMLIGKLKQKFAQDRGSKYRGVTLNGGKWQVLFTIDQEYIYLCSTPNEK